MGKINISFCESLQRFEQNIVKRVFNVMKLVVHPIYFIT